MEQSTFLIVLFFLNVFIQSTSGYYNLQFQFHHYTNPGGQKANGNCCEHFIRCISRRCDTHFKICLRNGGTSHSNNGGCLSGTSLNPGDVGRNDIKFGSTIGNINNPFSYSRNTIPQSGYQLYINVYDYDSFTSNDLIDKIFVEVPSTPTSVQSQKITGIHNRASLVLSYTLSCAQNYYGTDCSVYCIPHDDNQNGHYTCDSTTGNIVCLSGWQNPGNNCKDVACELVCGQGGNCTNSTCVCNDGWTGDQCDTPQCAVGCHPEGGYCNKPNECMCHENWDGTNCSGSLCAPNCSSVGGNCSIPGQCICLPGYTGDNCSIDMLPCQHQMPCQNGANCTNNNGSNGQYICTCSAGYTGSHCEDDINECLTEPCYNNSTCINLHDDFKCLCLSGWTGNTCEEDIDECAPNPCLNNGTCMDLFNGHYCLCTIEFEGLNCELEVNTCIPDPCENNATCVNLFTNYTCLCPTGYTGNNCEFSFSSTVSSSIVPTVKPELSTSIPIPAITGGVIGLMFIIVIFIFIIVLVMWFAKRKQNHHKLKDNREMDYENSSVDVLKMEHLMYEVPDDLVKPIYANEVKEKATPSHYDEPTLRTVPNELYNKVDDGTPPPPEYSSLNHNQYESVNLGMDLSSNPISNPLYGGTLEKQEQSTSSSGTVPNPLYDETLEREQPTSTLGTEKSIANPLYGGTLQKEGQPKFESQVTQQPKQ